MGYRIPISASISQETMAKIDKIKKQDGEKLSRGEVIDKAVAMFAESAKKEAAK